MLANTIANSQPNLQYRWIFFTSLLLSAWLIWLDPLINRDAIIYLRAADAFLKDGLVASQQLHARPILSIIIALIHQLTGLSLLHAGLAITSLSYAALCVGFVATVRTLGGDRTVQIIAAVVILSHPWLNHTRTAIMREPAYLALMILSLRELLLYLRHPILTHRLRWLGYTLLATLFRFEGMFFLALAPLALLFCRDLKNRWQHSALLLVPAWLIIALSSLVFMGFQSEQADGASVFPTIALYIDRLLAFPREFSIIAAQAAEPMLSFTSRDDATAAAVMAMVTVLLLNLARALSWPWVVTLIWAKLGKLQLRLRPGDRVILFSHIVIGLAYLLVFVLINRFMLERYCNQVVIFLLLYVPFVLSFLWRSKGWRKVLCLTLLVGLSIDTLHTSDREKMFIVDATKWVAASTPQNASLVSNEKYIGYFSGRTLDWNALQNRRFSLDVILSTPKLWRNTDYMVMYIKPSQDALWLDFLAQHKLQESRSFEGGRKGRVSVVEVAKTSHSQ